MEGGGGPAGGNSSFSQEEQDVSKALEASLRESSRSRRKTDSHNPHDKKRTEEVRFFAVRSLYLYCGSALVSMLIRIQGAKPMSFHPDLDPSHEEYTYKSLSR